MKRVDWNPLMDDAPRTASKGVPLGFGKNSSQDQSRMQNLNRQDLSLSNDDVFHT